MKKTFILLITLLGFYVLRAKQNNYLIYEGDTVNVIDDNNMKQGKWIILGSMRKLPGYDPDQKIEEGYYKDNRKTGVWKTYFPNGSIKSEITYKNNRPYGFYRIYYENGQIEEEGYWHNNRNVGDFKRYYKNGNLQQEFKFNQLGKREGVQKYYYENGNIMIEGEWSGGKEKGVIKEYYPNGDLKAEKTFIDGKLDPENTKIYEPTQPVEEIVKEENIVEKKEAPEVNPTDEKKNIGIFKGEGYAKLYNKNKQISKDGFFKNYKLIDGKWYKYDKNGILIRIEIYKNGIYVGDAPLEEQ